MSANTISNPKSVKSLFLVWLTLGLLTFIVGTLAAMFPKNLPSALLKQSVASILDIAQGIERETEYKANDKNDGK